MVTWDREDRPKMSHGQETVTRKEGEDGRNLDK